jgi:hypothetical protein
VPHTFAELGGERPARFLVWVTPGGHEGYFEELAAAALASPAGYPDPSELGRMLAEHGIWTVGGNDPRGA